MNYLKLHEITQNIRRRGTARLILADYYYLYGCGEYSAKKNIIVFMYIELRIMIRLATAIAGYKGESRCYQLLVAI